MNRWNNKQIGSFKIMIKKCKSITVFRCFYYQINVFTKDAAMQLIIFLQAKDEDKPSFS